MAGGGVPDFGRPILTGGCEALAIRAERDSMDCRFVAGQGQPHSRTRQGVVGTCRHGKQDQGDTNMSESVFHGPGPSESSLGVTSVQTTARPVLVTRVVPGSNATLPSYPTLPPAWTETPTPTVTATAPTATLSETETATFTPTDTPVPTATGPTPKRRPTVTPSATQPPRAARLFPRPISKRARRLD